MNMEGRYDGFDWDGGNTRKCQKHGVAIDDIEDLFRTGARIAPDPKHSQREDRFIAVGLSRKGQPMFVAFTVREKLGERLIRPVSARYMHERERARYEEAQGS